MATSPSRLPGLRRGASVGGLLLTLMAVQVAVLYLFVYLQQRVTWRGLPGYVPWLVLGGFTAFLLLVAVGSLRRDQPTGIMLSGGVFLVALSPFVMAVGWCEVPGATGPLRSAPRLVWRGVYVGLMTEWPRCAGYLNGILLVVGYSLLANGLWEETE